MATGPRPDRRRAHARSGAALRTRPRITYVGFVSVVLIALALVLLIRAVTSSGQPKPAAHTVHGESASTAGASRNASGSSTTTGSTSPSASTPSTDVYAAIRDPHNLSPAVAGDPEYLYVPNGIPGTVEVINPATYRIVRRISLGYRSFPEHVTPSWDLRWLYVDTSSASELAVIDP